MTLIVLLGCAGPNVEGVEVCRVPPSADQVASVRVISFYWYDADDPYKTRVSNERLTSPRRARDKALTEPDPYELLLA